VFVVIQNYNFVCCLYGYETSSPTLRKKRRLKVLENGVLRKIFGPQRDGVRGQWTRRLEKLYDLYPSPHIIPVIK
jgi:hypothetical protein